MSRSLLLDTHILLWLRGHSGLLSDSEQRLIDETPVRYVSAVSLWEIAILASLGRVPADDLIDLYEREQSIPAVLRHLATLIPAAVVGANHIGLVPAERRGRIPSSKQIG